VAGLAAIAVLFARSMLGPDRPDAQAAQHRSFSAMTWRDIVLTALAFLSVAAAILHFAVIEQHFTEYWLYGAFFIAVGLFELAWALLAVAAPSHPLYWASVVINSLTIVAYVITRTVGLLVGPAAHQTEMIGFGDLTATAFEAVLVIGSLLLLFRAWGRGRVRNDRPRRHGRERSGVVLDRGRHSVRDPGGLIARWRHQPHPGLLSSGVAEPARLAPVPSWPSAQPLASRSRIPAARQRVPFRHRGSRVSAGTSLRRDAHFDPSHWQRPPQSVARTFDWPAKRR
jgi:hypothetical protein